MNVRTVVHTVLLLALALLPAACGGPDVAPDPSVVALRTPRPVILDLDMVHEDMIAALFLLRHPNVDVRAITVAGTGEAHCGPGVRHALGLVALAGAEPLPVACGRETPLAGDHEFPAAWRERADAAYGVTIPTGGEPAPVSAPDLIVKIVDEASEPVSIVAVGPLTNVAQAIQAAPELAGGVDRIYIMGGAVEVPGNVGASRAGIDNEVAEWNIYVDPAAANIVLESGIPVTLVPLDATRDVPVTREFHRALGAYKDAPPARLAHELLAANLELMDIGGFHFWDTLTAAIFTDESLATFEEIELSVVEEEGPESGYTKPTPGATPVRVATAADRARFEKLLVTVLNWPGE